MGLGLLVVIGGVVAIGILGIRVITEYERGVVFRLGRFAGVKSAGLKWIIPGVDRMVRISLREIVMDVPPQEVITRDNVSVKVNAVLYFRVLHPEKSVIQVENYLYGTSQMAQTTLRSVCGQAELDELLAEREGINQKLQQIIDLQTEPWGVKVRNVELKQIDLPQEMQRAMAKQAEAEREKRSKVIHAEGEHQAASTPRASTRRPSASRMRPGCWRPSSRRSSSGTCRRWPISRPSTARRSSSRSRSTSCGPSTSWRPASRSPGEARARR
jgi:regulator of protease activity HflC (stomatin/prohibitin superfamily)